MFVAKDCSRVFAVTTSSRKFHNSISLKHVFLTHVTCDVLKKSLKVQNSSISQQGGFNEHVSDIG